MSRLRRIALKVRFATAIVPLAGAATMLAQAPQTSSSVNGQVLQKEINHLEEELQAVKAQLSALQGVSSASPSVAPGPPEPQTAKTVAGSQQNKPKGAPDSAPGAATPSITGVNPIDVATGTV